MIRVYVAGPYSIGNQEFNAKSMIDTSQMLLTLGYTPYCPLLTHWWHLEHPLEWAEWMRYHLKWLNVCDCLYRMAGESVGADIEVEYAKKIGIPVYYNMDQLLYGDEQ